jgi:hypothetical protein
VKYCRQTYYTTTSEEYNDRFQDIFVEIGEILEVGKEPEVRAACGDRWNTGQHILNYLRYMDKMDEEGIFLASRDLEDGLYFKKSLVIVKDEN